MNKLRMWKAKQSDSDDENGVVGRPQWDADYRLQAFPAMGMFEEYLEMGLSLCLHCNSYTCYTHNQSGAVHRRLLVHDSRQMIMAHLFELFDRQVMFLPMLDSWLYYCWC